MGSDGDRALLAWSGNSRLTAYLQLVEAGEEMHEAFVLFDSPESLGPWLGPKHLVRIDDGWWMSGAVASWETSELGIQSFWFADAASGGMTLSARTMLLGGPPCWPGCDDDWPFGFDIRHLAALRWQDELWFGFQDLTEHTNNPVPYRIVRVGRSCRYPTLFEIYHPELMPEE